MGFKKIYVVGMDLDYSLGYAKSVGRAINPGMIGHWKVIYRNTINDDLQIIKESTDLTGTEIINLDKDSWHTILPFGELE